MKGEVSLGKIIAEQRSIPMILLVFLFLPAFGFQGTRGLWSPDEGYYVGVAQEMIEHGDWLIPKLQTVPWLDKPSLSLWGIASGMLLFGENEWGARFFHAVSFVLTIFLIYLLGKSFGPELSTGP